MVLCNGILSYYNSEDEVEKGCRASIKLSACDIIAYPADNTRLDVVVRNEQRWYLKTGNAAERQAWLIAMGSSKAHTGELAVQDPVVEELRSSMNEVKFFRDLLVQQTIVVRNEAEKVAAADTEKLVESSQMLAATCDTFLLTLAKCAKLAESSSVLCSVPPPVGALLKQNERGDSSTVAVPKLGIKSRHRKKSHPTRNDSVSSLRSMSASLPSPPIPEISNIGPHMSSTSSPLPFPHDSPFAQNKEVDRPVIEKDTVSSTVSGTISPPTPSPDASLENTPPLSTASEHSSTFDAILTANCTSAPKEEVESFEPDDRTMTFFSSMSHSFSDVKIEEDGGIPVEVFLLASQGIIPVLDKIGSKAFAPVKIDFLGNILKLQTKRDSNRERFTTLQAIVGDEIRTSSTKVRSSATDALMWLKRGLRFVQFFLIKFKNGERDLTLALHAAYTDALKSYHGWVVRGIFAVSTHAPGRVLCFVPVVNVR